MITYSWTKAESLTKLAEEVAGEPVDLTAEIDNGRREVIVTTLAEPIITVRHSVVGMKTTHSDIREAALCIKSQRVA